MHAGLTTCWNGTHANVNSEIQLPTTSAVYFCKPKMAEGEVQVDLFVDILAT